MVLPAPRQPAEGPKLHEGGTWLELRRWGDAPGGTWWPAVMMARSRLGWKTLGVGGSRFYTHVETMVEEEGGHSRPTVQKSKREENSQASMA